MAQAELDLSGIVGGQPRISPPIYNALAALQESVNDVDETQIDSARTEEILAVLFGTYSPWASYTPVILGGTVAGSGTYSEQVGQWTRIGNTVIFTATATVTSHTGSGNHQLSLPTAVATLTGSAVFVFPASFVNATTPASVIHLVGLAGSGATSIVFQGTRDGASAANMVLDTGCTVYASGMYKAA